MTVATSRLTAVVLALSLPAGAASGARLSVLSRPEGATVHIDGQARGVTPLELSGLPSGDHRVSLFREGYLENSRVLGLESGGRRVLDVELTPSAPGEGSGRRRAVYLAAAGAGGLAAILLLRGGNEAPRPGSVGVAPAGVGIASVTDFTFTAQGGEDPEGGELSYGWDFGDGSNGSGPSASHIYRREGSYTVTLTVSNGEDSARATASVTVGSLSGVWVSRLAGVTRTWTITQNGSSFSGTFTHSQLGGGTVRGDLSPPRSMSAIAQIRGLNPWSFAGTIDSDINTFTGVANGSGFYNVEMTFRRQ
jgi:hypothetical protein